MAKNQERLTVGKIRRWVRAHHERTGRWPGRDSGPVIDEPGFTWSTIDRCLKRGGRGLPGDSSLSSLIKESGGLQNLRRAKPGLTKKMILEWADEHYQRTGKWPDRDAGPVLSAPYIAWGTIEKRLRHGGLDLPGGETLTRLLRDHRGVWDRRGKPRLTEKRILKWADDHFNRTGRWPVTLSGRLREVPNEDWAAIDMALRDGRRGLPGGSSLARLLDEHRRRAIGARAPRLTAKQIMAWAKAHKKRTGAWPSPRSGQVHGSGGETWASLDAALRHGRHGLRGGSSLADLLERHCPVDESTSSCRTSSYR